MRITKIIAFHGPNVWSRQPALEVWIDGLKERNLPGDWQFNSEQWMHHGERLCAGDAELTADVLWKWTIQIQQWAGEPVRQGWIDPQRTGRCFAVEFVEESTARQAVDLAIRAYQAAQSGARFSLSDAVEELCDQARSTRLGRTTGPLVAAAQARGVPAMRLDRESLVQLGHGVRQRRISAAVTDRAGYLAEAISRDKYLTKQLLAQVGVPVPVGEVVESEASAWQAACRIGLPVVVKPLDADYGHGVSLRLMTREEVYAATTRALGFSRRVVVEQFLPGDHHRLLVVGESVVAAIRREASHVTGDGCRTVAELIEEANRDPRRGPEEDRSRPWYPILVDQETEQALTQQGLRLDTVPRPGQAVLTRWTTPEWNGDALHDVTDELHPHLAETVVDAVRMVGLDVAGVDLVATDIRRPLEEQGGGVLEINAEPAILIHMSPVCRPARPVPEAIIARIYPRAELSRIPITAICGGESSQRVADWLAAGQEQAAAGPLSVGIAGPEGASLQGRRLAIEPMDAMAACRAMLLHPRVEALVCRMTAEDIRQGGLAFDRCDAAMFLSLEGGNCCEQLRSALVLAEAVQDRGAVVINVDDPAGEQLFADLTGRAVPISLNPQHPAIEESRGRGGRAAFLQGNAVILAEGGREFSWSPIGNPLHEGATPALAAAWLATVATAWALGWNLECLKNDPSERRVCRDSEPGIGFFAAAAARGV